MEVTVMPFSLTLSHEVLPTALAEPWLLRSEKMIQSSLLQHRSRCPESAPDSRAKSLACRPSSRSASRPEPAPSFPAVQALAPRIRKSPPYIHVQIAAYCVS
jgi:hypothetical protein